jgi:hypothetical protein
MSPTEVCDKETRRLPCSLTLLQMLYHILWIRIKHRHIRGYFLTWLRERGGGGVLTHLQYADDTILMCESDTDSIIHTLCENLK